ncbi:mitochondrial E3 ubiquitin protein ligase 1 [Condylostylus longicornis]|uniref:mitochondrial E3 ubiquitin protein ligase 1 n=1 Tax=Condylostylus longicornis TaxID=2530218 RepID=UPI00244DD02A|nr:mitochondrial E3 ubiquitin protein ligase 1 [Condylostylus longicornis]XP_055373290.1 mitochondrial E3 ubiquitin protein ligase 1 [Condylostylus longicornis]XP_055373291.1 mitochondrial E3 ubiquitin protein ligase 1 [Condylostylus longicornis]XP_055373292.1 mitochondrial E3 ubiquitin protein ligase 1 [Condylostylus longicornis]
MEFINEGIALGVDLLILGICLKEYYSYKSTLKSLKAAPQLNLDSDLKSTIAKEKNKIPYAVIRGIVTPIGSPMRSVMNPSVTGVLQVIKLSEHRVARGFAGFWTEQRKLIHVSSNEIPFAIKNNDVDVEIIDGLGAAILDLDVVYDNYEPSSLSFFDHIFGFFSGVRQKGLQTTEEVLRDGSFLTAIGELELDGNQLKMQSSSVGPLFLTTATKSTLVRKFHEAKSSMMVKIGFCSILAVALVGIIGRKFYIKKKQERDEKRIKDRLECERRERRARTRPLHLTEDQLCVVCSTNPKEVIILPCGHVCLCEDCSQKIKDNCPVCRSLINSRAAAFIS